MNYQGIIDNIVDLAGDKLNSWEQGFIDNIYNRYYDDPELMTNKQKAHILKIQDKYLKG